MVFFQLSPESVRGYHQTLNETPQPTEGKIPLTPPTASTSDGHSKEPSICYYIITSPKTCQANVGVKTGIQSLYEISSKNIKPNAKRQPLAIRPKKESLALSNGATLIK